MSTTATPPKHEKMSKSRGNGIGVDEVVWGVFEIDAGYEFRLQGVPLTIKEVRRLGVWRDRSGDDGGDYFTALRFGKQPVFLHQVGNDEPCQFWVGGVTGVTPRNQHPKIKYFLKRRIVPSEKPEG